MEAANARSKHPMISWAWGSGRTRAKMNRPAFVASSPANLRAPSWSKGRKGTSVLSESGHQTNTAPSATRHRGQPLEPF